MGQSSRAVETVERGNVGRKAEEEAMVEGLKEGKRRRVKGEQRTLDEEVEENVANWSSVHANLITPS